MRIDISRDEQRVFLYCNINDTLSLGCILQLQERWQHGIEIKVYDLIKILKTAHADIEIKHALLGEFNYVKTTDLLGQLLIYVEISGRVELLADATGMNHSIINYKIGRVHYKIGNLVTLQHVKRSAH